MTAPQQPGQPGSSGQPSIFGNQPGGQFPAPGQPGVGQPPAGQPYGGGPAAQVSGIQGSGKQGSNKPLFIGIAVVLLLCIGCAVVWKVSPRDDKDKLAGKGEVVASPTVPQPSSAADLLVDGMDGLGKALKQRVIKTAGVTKPATVRCDTEEIKSKFSCVVVYEGRKVTYQVTATSTGSTTWKWEATPDHLVVTKAGVWAEYYAQFSKFADNLRCDTGIAEVAEVAPGTVLKQKCYYKHRSAKETMSKRIKITDGELQFV